MMGKGHGRRRKQPCVEEAENDSVYVDSTIAVKNISLLGSQIWDSSES